ncbi:response regulator transcription factor [Rhizobium sp. P40RR-XXII]|uniref:response regulator transcription factor n=1 Tax=unclassified Rhizobium TaxID=2613769 RepID=UPI0014577B51|nr:MULTISPECIES: response regulator transcription factor [unclassified Rhizobium]NLR84715.1 response regulator transcription factor [Rhizobium sp. P28RR-XV]NLS16378.1 response regulator transcription factor [Rhizobium sp. P40RR-XXII]
MRILLLEDEPEMASALSAALQARDAIVDHVSMLADAEEAARSIPYDVILLDRQVPDGDGLSIVPRLRAAGVGTPVIVLTARGDLEDRIGGLDTGADDYLVKPFAVEELLARLRAIMRRPGDVRSEVVSFGRLSYDFDCHDVLIDGERLELPRRELLVFEALARRMGRTVPRHALEEAVYGFADDIQSNTLDAHVSRLRRKLASLESGLEIHPVRGVGYLMRKTS